MQGVCLTGFMDYIMKMNTAQNITIGFGRDKYLMFLGVNSQAEKRCHFKTVRKDTSSRL